MKCPECQFDNREGIKFCGECGHKFKIACPECGTNNRAGNKFCDECGHDLRTIKETPPVNYSEPESYTPKFLADKILTTRSSIEGERKLVTVLFADVANYTAMSEKLDPEEVHQIMDGCFKILMDEIHKYEGTINQFTGDGVMALFGAPVAHEDHAQRACYAALSIQKALGKYGDKIEKDTGVEFKMRVGLNSGPVIVGAIGDDLRMDYTAVGDTTNLGSRMESMAGPGTILVSGNTHRLVRDFFEFETLGKIEVKGKKEPQEAFELIKTGEVATRIGASVAKGLTRFVGRKNSMPALLDAFDKVKSGSGQVVGLVGEAGVGKSRLLLEMRNMLSQGEYSYIEGRCLQYGGSMTYLPILGILRSYFEINEGDREFAIKKKIKDKILKLDEKLINVLPPFQDILSLKVEDDKYIKHDPQIKRVLIFEALRDLFIRDSQNKSLILVVEDQHWIDKTSEEFIDYLIGWLVNTSILLIILYRPEYTHQWGSKSYYTKIGVDQLGTVSSTALIQAMLEGGEVAPELRRLIIDRTSGNPLFMEEFTHTLLENGSIERKDKKHVLSRQASDIQVPDTIQGIIAARMDRLEDNIKKTMQVASVIGRDFAFRILQSITKMKEELKSYLLNLQGLEFIYEKSLFPELEYVFKHALTQEVAYNSLLLRRRKEIHEKIGEAIEQIYSKRLKEFYEMLAYHYAKSDNYEKGFEYSKLSAKKALKSASFIDALSYTKKSILCLERLPKTEANQRRIIDARTAFARYCMPLNYHVEAKESVAPIADLAIGMNYRKRLPMIYVALGSYFQSIEEDFSNGEKVLSKAIKISEEVNDWISLHLSHYFLGCFLSLNDEADKGFYHLSKCLELGTFINDKGIISITKSSIAYFNYLFQGSIQNAFKLSSESLQMAKEENAIDTRIKGMVYCCHGAVCYVKGLFVEGERDLLRSVAFCEKNNFYVWEALSCYNLGNLYADTREYEKSQYYYSHAISLLESHRYNPSLINFCKIGIARLKIFKNKRDIDLSELFAYHKKINVNCFKGWGANYIGEILLTIGDNISNSAEGWIKKAIEANDRFGFKWHLGRDYVLYTEFYKRKGDQSKAREKLGKAIEILKECGADGWVEKYEKELASLP